MPNLTVVMANVFILHGHVTAMATVQTALMKLTAVI